MLRLHIYKSVGLAFFPARPYSCPFVNSTGLGGGLGSPEAEAGQGTGFLAQI